MMLDADNLHCNLQLNITDLVTRILSQAVHTDRAKCSQCLQAVCQFPVHNISATYTISHFTKGKEAPHYTVSHCTGLLLTDLLLNTEKMYEKID